MKNNLLETYKSDKFKDETAGYIDTDGSFIYAEDYHGEEDNEYKNLGLPEFSSTHYEEDTCVRIYKEPNEIQYKKLEEIIDYFLNTYYYCKVEIWDKPNKNYSFYNVYSLFEGACKDYTWNEKVGNWTGYKLIQIIKNNINKKNLDEAYNTGNVNGKNIFDTSTLGGYSYYSQCIPGDPENEYMKVKHNKIGKIVQMSPNEYFSLCAKMFNITVDDLKEQKLLDDGEGYINKLKDVILKEKKQFPMTFICFPDKQQEGLHRMYVAGELFGWGEKFPVLVISKYDKLKEQLLLELNRNQLINKSKNSDNYKDQSKGRNRWERRNHSKIDRRVDQYNKIDMNTFFKKDELKIGINVHGETDDYIVTIRFNNALKAIADEIKRNNNKLEFKCVLIALQRTFNNGDVFVSCTCLHPDTKIKLLDGTNPTVAEMAERFNKGEKLYVFSTDEKGDFKPGEVEKVWVTKNTNEFIKITLDNDKEIITTPDHLYMLRDGSYEEAQNLQVGQSLMPLYMREQGGYPLIKYNSEIKGWKSLYKEVAHYYKANEIEETSKKATNEDSMKYKVAIHHKDFNKYNNTPENLQIMTAREHWDYHAKNMALRHQQPYFREKMNRIFKSEEFSEKMKHRFDNETPEQREKRLNKLSASNKGKHFGKQSKETCLLKSKNRRGISSGPCKEETKRKISEGQKRVWANLTEEERKEKLNKMKLTPEQWAKQKIGCQNRDFSKMFTKEVREKISKSKKGVKLGPNTEEGRLNKSKAALKRSKEISKNISNYWNNLSEKDKKSISYKIQITKIGKVFNNLLKLNLELNEYNYKEFIKNHHGYPSWEKYFSTFNEAISYFSLNHKIKKIEYIKLEKDIPVYDIQVKNWNNFAVDSGVILHNCKDWIYRQSYFSTRDGYNSGIPEIRASNITNPKDTKGGGCKHVNLVIGNIDWVMKIASVINNYIHYMEEHYQRLYADVIFPRLFNMPYQRAIQLNLFDTGTDELDSEENEIKLSNRYGRTRGQFRSDVRINNMRNFRGPQLQQSQEVNNKPLLQQNVSNNIEKDQ